MLNKEWYHSIEIEPGVFTPGVDHNNIIVTRQLLKGIDVEGKNCLDIGAMDGLISVLLLNRGAAHVTAHERVDFSDRINFIKKCLDVDFEYIKGITLEELKDVAKERGLSPFDVVVFSGVLYHMFDPMSGIATVRSLTRTGGMMVIETSAAFTDKDECLMLFNNEGRFFPGTNYWQISVSCLDYLLRFNCFEVADVRYFKSMKIKGGHQGRIALACKAVDKPVASKTDNWMSNTAKFQRDYRQFLDLNKGQIADVQYTNHPKNPVFHEGTKSINVFKMIQKTPESKPKDTLSQDIKLKLGAVV